MAEMVTLTLAHPVPAHRAAALHAREARDYSQGEKITVPRGDAHTIIGYGYAAGVDPDDTSAVNKALGIGAPPKVAEQQPPAKK